MDEGVCSADLQSRPIRLSVTRAGVRKLISFADNKVFRLPTFFVSTVNKEAVTSCKTAMQTEEVSLRRSSLICVAHLQVYVRVSDYRWWPNNNYTCIGSATRKTNLKKLRVLVVI